MRRISHTISLVAVGLIASASLAIAQTTNQAAVDTMTKDVAAAVFASIPQPKAQDIYGQLLNCGDGCDPQTIIRTVGGWDAVGVKMQELSELKNTAPFIAMEPAQANAAIRKQLAQFYDRYRKDTNYGKPLSAPVRAMILAKIDRMLPPAETAEPAPAVAGSPATGTNPAVTGDEATVDPTTFQLGQLERQVKETQEKQLWMMIVSGLIGLLVGAGAIYLLLYRGTQAEAKTLLDENNRLRNKLETAQRTKGSPEVNAIRPEYRQKVSAYDAIVAELGTDNPLTTIRQLKQQATGTSPKPSPGIRSTEPQIESSPVSEPIQLSEPLLPIQTPEPVVTATRSEVFYFPPPDPTGQFDLSQKSSTLSPESAYRFSVSADNPSVASFRFEADPGRLARFLTYRNYMIEPACDSENTYTTTHTRVAMRRDGEAVLENGTWRVKTKALIRYE